MLLQQQVEFGAQCGARIRRRSREAAIQPSAIAAWVSVEYEECECPLSGRDEAVQVKAACAPVRCTGTKLRRIRL